MMALDALGNICGTIATTVFACLLVIFSSGHSTNTTTSSSKLHFEFQKSEIRTKTRQCIQEFL